MKKLLAIPLIFTTVLLHAQFQTSMRAGYSFKTVDIFLTPGIAYTKYNVTLAAEMMVNVKRDAPVNFIPSLSYQWNFIEVGGGYAYMLYTTDTYDSYKNHWAWDASIAAHYKIAFVKVEYIEQFKLSIGVRTNF